MIPDVAPERLALPALAPPPPRPPFPLVATAAPVLVSVGIWAVTGSVYSLLFAALGPVVALGSLMDGRRQRRRAARRETERTMAALGRAGEQLRQRQDAERARLAQLAPPLAELCLPHATAARWAGSDSDVTGMDAGPQPVRIGLARRPSPVRIDDAASSPEADDELPPAVRDALRELRTAAAVLDDAPWIVDAREGVGIIGPPTAARSLARSIAVQLTASASPATTRLDVLLPAGVEEPWVSGLPHAVTVSRGDGVHGVYRFTDGGAVITIAFAAQRGQLPAGLGSVVDLSDGLAARPDHVHWEALAAARARDAANVLRATADEGGLVAAQRIVPTSVSLTELLDAADAAPDGSPQAPLDGLRAPIGRHAAGIAELDLVHDGPHAVVAGTTGSGKSELLVSWVLAMAARHSPDRVTFLLVDFKGGAAFAPLSGLPHVIGIVSDLDARRSTRAIESLRAELLRRERMLADAGVRSIDELETRAGAAPRALARLVIVVDEFAAVVSGQPELHELFADLSGRGRSLGLHLILCTQRPSGVVRDAVLANVTLRISLRVTDRSDSIAMLGTDAATRLSPADRGRALIADGSGDVREVQIARAEPGDAERALGETGQRSDDRRQAATVWCDPLPELLPLPDLLRDASVDEGAGVPFGRIDLPAQQCQPIARIDPATDGHLLVVGAARSGRTTVLRTIAASAERAGVRCTVVPGEPAEAWSLLSELHERPEPGAGFVLLDDLDLLLGRLDPDARHDLTELLTGFARDARHQTLVVTAQRLTGGLQHLAGLFDGRVLLRHPSREEHVLSGGDGAAYDPRSPAGAGWWMGRRGAGATLQVAIGAEPLPRARRVDLPVLRPASDRALAVVCRRPADIARRWSAGPARVVLLGDAPVPDETELRVSRGEAPLVLVGDPDAWQAEWSLLGVARREWPIAVIGCGPAELRAVARVRDAPPLLGDREGECWWIDGDAVRRALLELPGEPA